MIPASVIEETEKRFVSRTAERTETEEKLKVVPSCWSISLNESKSELGDSLEREG